MSEKQPHVERMKQEYGELNAKITSLVAFTSGATFQALSAEDRTLMVAQLGAMQSYSAILSMRLNRAKQ